MDYDDVVGGQLRFRIRRRYCGIVPLRDLSEENSSKRFRCEVQIGTDARDVVRGDHGPKHRREVENFSPSLGTELLDLFVVHWAVGGAEVNSSFGDLRD